jgi:hypothetical protein
MKDWKFNREANKQLQDNLGQPQVNDQFPDIIL